MIGNEFLFRLPGGRYLLSLVELEQRMDDVISDSVHHDFSMMDKIMVEVYDSRILRNHEPKLATLGKMSVTSAIQKFQ